MLEYVIENVKLANRSVRCIIVGYDVAPEVTIKYWWAYDSLGDQVILDETDNKYIQDNILDRVLMEIEK